LRSDAAQELDGQLPMASGKLVCQFDAPSRRMASQQLVEAGGHVGQREGWRNVDLERSDHGVVGDDNQGVIAGLRLLGPCVEGWTGSREDRGRRLSSRCRVDGAPHCAMTSVLG